MFTLIQASHPQLGEQQLTQQAAAIAAGCFPALRDRFLTPCPIVQVRAANREKRFSGRKP